MEKLDRFTSFYKEPDTFESKMMQTLKENMAEKRFYFVAYDAHVPIALCGCRGEEEYFVLGPFSYGLTNTFECRNCSKNMKESPLPNIFQILRSRQPVICSGIQTGRYRKSQNISTMEA